MDQDESSSPYKRDYAAYKRNKKVQIKVMDTPPLLTKSRIETVQQDPYQSKVRRTRRRRAPDGGSANSQRLPPP